MIEKIVSFDPEGIKQINLVQNNDEEEYYYKIIHFMAPRSEVLILGEALMVI